MGKTVLFNVLQIAIGHVYIQLDHVKIVKKDGQVIAKVIINDHRYIFGYVCFCLILFAWRYPAKI